MIRLFTFVAIMFFATTDSSRAQERTALLIGNGDYPSGQLGNPVNDARDLAETLSEAHFDVTIVLDASRDEMLESITTFGRSLAPDGIAFVFYAGHGLQLEGRNVLLPVDVRPDQESDIRHHAIDVDLILEAISNGEPRLAIVVLDACRDNPFPTMARSRARGLAPTQSDTRGLFVSYSTSPGRLALDGQGRNSPYTKHLVESIRIPGLSLEEVFKRTLKAVHKDTNGFQAPWISSSFFGDFTFNDALENVTFVSGGVEPETVGPRTISRSSDSEALLSVAEGTYDVIGMNPDGTRYGGTAILSRIGSSWRFEWLIGGEIFVGIGEHSGNYLTIDWGDSHAAMYTYSQVGRLDGTWADGSAWETLVLREPLNAEHIAGARDTPGADLSGIYKVRGTNRDGSRYTGNAAILLEGLTYHVQWWIEGETLRGRGRQSDGLLIVEWGAESPAIYRPRSDGSLVGEWDDGRALETLTPL